MDRVNATTEENEIALMEDAVSFLILNTIGALAHFLFAFLAVDMANYSAQKQVTRVRKLFFRAMLGKEMAWFDTNLSDKNFAVKMTE